MDKNRLFLLLLLLGLLGGYSCTRKALVRKYYLIEQPKHMESINEAATPAANAACELLPVEIFPAFADERIALRLQTHELTYYNYHLWAIRPQEALTQSIETYLQNQHIFSPIASRFWKLIPDYRLQVRVYQLEAIEEENRLSAHLKIDFTLIDNDSREVVVFHQADRTQPLKKRSMNLFASAISDLCYNELQVFARAAKSFLAERESPATGQK